jgi:hypothetical protein
MISLKISELPIAIQKLALCNQRKQGNSSNRELLIRASKGDGNFSWDLSLEGASFWEKANMGFYATGDSYNNLLSLKDLPDNLRILALNNQKAQKKDYNPNVSLTGAFDWARSRERHAFWSEVNKDYAVKDKNVLEKSETLEDIMSQIASL